MGMLLECKRLIHQPLSFPFDVCFPLFGMGDGNGEGGRRGEGKREVLTVTGMLVGCK